MNINWKLRFKNWRTWLLSAVAVLTIVWSAGGFQVSDLDSWSLLWNAFCEFLSKPVAIIAVITALIANYVDPTTSGFSDSERALNYTEPRKDGDK
ncbi:holin [Listeria phage LP-037]|uniref:Holin n=6 Tax=Homburgvirus TaxID=1921125 RepID=S4UAD2_9CAUD|nr:holin [Listeria phage P70]YP_008240571.1 holin [Listeria phage LP-037]YP_009045156.1 holin [Listeria phage LP-114]QDK04621.1 holin [Listeria phage LP-010]QDK04732.1 holin [Listeria phage LP-013]QDK04846.1 holin [Listeria phage LP-031]AFQ96194.1 holin [Listeria phage P70]AGI11708.1 holin [Listeria phage LP-037]